MTSSDVGVVVDKDAVVDGPVLKPLLVLASEKLKATVSCRVSFMVA